MLISCPYCQYCAAAAARLMPAGQANITCPQCHQTFCYTLQQDIKESASGSFLGLKLLHKKANKPHTQPEQKQSAGNNFKAFGTTPPLPWPGTEDNVSGIVPAIPFENPAYSFIAGYGATIQRFFTAPGEFFKWMSWRRGLWQPSKFVAVSAVLLLICMGGYIAIVGSYPIENSYFSALKKQYNPLVLHTAVLAIFPFALVLYHFLLAVLFHFFLLLAIPFVKSLQFTYRTVCYSSFLLVFLLLPKIGILLFSLLFLFYMIVGLKYVHNISYIRVAVALFLLFGSIVLSLVVFFPQLVGL